MSVKVIQHIYCEILGTIAESLAAENVAAEYIRPFRGERIPTGMEGSSGLILMGGPMGVYEQDRNPFLREEICLIEGALKEQKPILGICLGSQLLASALGGEVTKGKKKEIGWYPVSLTEAAMTDPLWTEIKSPFIACHWHGDIFNLPQGAVCLASSELTACQAFRYGRNAYGFLFHMEVTRRIIEDMVNSFTDELKEAAIDGQEIVEKAKDHLPALQTLGSRVFGRWAKLLERSA